MKKVVSAERLFAALGLNEPTGEDLLREANNIAANPALMAAEVPPIANLFNVGTPPNWSNETVAALEDLRKKVSELPAAPASSEREATMKIQHIPMDPLLYAEENEILPVGSPNFGAEFSAQIEFSPKIRRFVLFYKTGPAGELDLQSCDAITRHLGHCQLLETYLRSGSVKDTSEPDADVEAAHRAAGILKRPIEPPDHITKRLETLAARLGSPCLPAASDSIQRIESDPSI